MDPNQFRVIQWRGGGLAVWLTLLLVLLFLSSVSPEWLINAILLLIGVSILLPVVGFFGLRWWLQRSLVQGNCPVCDYPLNSIKQLQVRCPNCGEILQVQEGRYVRPVPPGTVDVQVIDAIDVTVEQLSEDDF
ncbi:hypothetical protein [Prochlorothrix hollandica]|uniref:Uncharacterized protein n=1 Tax=Prochlorothrix hollandica PCC 9006 = CALU 1027 TaxID=317619 RepID=A0A0M2Q262_PROHO|nr:hypothetical protein [Prochlorothrix hollandica]KKJ00707.1 hypothetical protein PROH_05325 [Prochlorothrix hollandica PCC 9006 = CALU 1027]